MFVAASNFGREKRLRWGDLPSSIARRRRSHLELDEDGLLEQEYRNRVQASKKRLHRSTDKRNRKALEENEFGISWCLILVENHSINHHVVPCANVVDSDWNADFHFGPYDIFIEHFSASRHIMVVVVSETCAHAKGAATAKAKLSNIF